MNNKESRKQYYEKNKAKWKTYYKKQMDNPVKHKQRIEKTKEWKQNNPEKTKEQKRKDDAKYHARRKKDKKYLEKRRAYASEYNNRPEVKVHHKQIQKLHRANPEIKKKNAEYNKKYHRENPEKVLRNIRNHLTKLGNIHDLKWYQFLDQLRGWSEIVHKDCKETCQICNRPSEEAELSNFRIFSKFQKLSTIGSFSDSVKSSGFS